jgi:hypothetical protein
MDAYTLEKSLSNDINGKSIRLENVVITKLAFSFLEEALNQVLYTVIRNAPLSCKVHPWGYYM